MLSNPIVVRMAVVLFVSAFGLWLATLLLRRMRRILTEESFAVDSVPELDQFPMHTYNAVIQQLKQQKHELLSVQQVERRRAKTSENISAAVLSNLSSGVLFLTTNGLVRTANAAAKSILGFASPVGMSVSEIFRDARLSSSLSLGSQETLAAAVQASLREPGLRTQGLLRSVEADYNTPAGNQRILEITISPVPTPSGETLGAACLITDKTEFASYPAAAGTTRRNVRRDGLSAAQFAGYDFQLRATSGGQFGSHTGAAVGRRHCFGSSRPGSHHWRFSNRRKSREGRWSLSSIGG